MANADIVAKLVALGACRPATGWVKEEGFKTAQEAWDSPSIHPKDMLWFLGRTQGSSLVRRRKQILMAVDLLDLTHGKEWYEPNPFDIALRAALIAYGEGQLRETSLRRVWRRAMDAGRGWTIGDCVHACVRVGSYTAAGCYARLVPWSYPDRPEMLTKQQALIRKHFPKPPRLS